MTWEHYLIPGRHGQNKPVSGNGEWLRAWCIGHVPIKGDRMAGSGR